MRNSQQYIEQAAVTLSKQWHGEKVAKALLFKILQNCADSLGDLEAIKKTLFYGKELPKHLQELNLEIGSDTKFMSEELSPQSCAELAKEFASEEEGQVIIHGILGAVSETSELLALLNGGLTGFGIDRLKLAEEMGDVFWYCAIIALVSKFDFEQVQDMNIAKLQARFPEGFKAYDALHRNIAKETAAMEKVEVTA